MMNWAELCLLIDFYQEETRRREKRYARRFNRPISPRRRFSIKRRR
ncbi:MAG TPA: hypothetical protein VHP83_03195 [Aggregatilineaceae bacterium]|nr:hypothetical protein [Aggregatilineaceae bacterium]